MPLQHMTVIHEAAIIDAVTQLAQAARVQDSVAQLGTTNTPDSSSARGSVAGVVPAVCAAAAALVRFGDSCFLGILGLGFCSDCCLGFDVDGALPLLSVDCVAEIEAACQYA